MTIIQHFQVVTAHNPLLYYNQMLSNLKCRCQSKGAAEARGGAGAGAVQLPSAPGSRCSPDPAEPGDNADPLTSLILCKAAFLIAR